MKKCLIFGGSGFLGKNLCRRLLETRPQYKIVVYGKTSKHLEEISETFPGIETIKGDLEFETDFRSLMDGVEVVFYLISSTNATNKSLLLEFERNVLPTIRVLEACKERGVRFIFFLRRNGVWAAEVHAHGRRASDGSYFSLWDSKTDFGKMYRILWPYPWAGLPDPAYNESLWDVSGSRQETRRHRRFFLARAILGEPIEIWGDGNAVLAGAWKKVFDEIPNADEASAPNPDQRVVQELLMQEIWKEEE